MPHLHNLPTVLMLVTSHNQLGSTGRPTGIWAEEMTTAYWAFVDAGWRVRFASPLGGEPPIVAESLKADVPSVKRFFADAKALAALSACVALRDVADGSFHALFVPGGHGTMWDLPSSPDVARIVGHAFDAGLPIGAVCHGPAALVGATTIDGQPVVKGLALSCFTDDEEAAVGLTEVVPFLLQSRLRALGAQIAGGPNFTSQAVRAGHLVTGQNPQSTDRVAQLMLAVMAERMPSAA